MPGHIYETERGMDIYFSDNNAVQDGLLKLFQRSMAGGEWDNVRPLEGFDTNGNDNYPFMLSNGITLYFASDGEGSMGGYDIFRSNMNTETGQFYPPFNLGMPYNSEANDYMMAINEVSAEAVDANLPIVIMNADCNEDAERVKARLNELRPELKVWICDIGPVIGAHCGPGALGIIYVGGDRPIVNA